MNQIKVGIIGTGFGANVHAPLFTLHPGFEVVAISSVHRGNVDEVQKQTGIKNIYTDWRKMLEQEELDLVSIVSNPSLHHEMTLEAYARGLHVLCEKPMSLNVQQSIEMIQARDQAQRMGAINFEYRNYPTRMKVKETIASGTLGRILHIHYKCNLKGYHVQASRRRDWLGNKEAGGGMLGAIGSHMFDSLIWWAGEDVQEVTGKLHTHIPYWKDAAGAEEFRTADDAFHVIGCFKNGTTFTTEFLYPTRQNQYTWYLEVSGTEGTLVMTNDQKVWISIGDEELRETKLPDILVPPTHINAVAARYYPVFLPHIDNLYQKLTKPEQPTPLLATFEDGLQVQRILDAVRESDSTGKRITL